MSYNHTTDLEKIVNSLQDELTETINKTLGPLVKRMNENNNQYSALSSIMKQLPEFQEIVEENANLKYELAKLQKTLTQNKPFEQVKLEISEIKKYKQVSAETEIYDSFKVRNSIEETDKIVDENKDELSEEENSIELTGDINSIGMCSSNDEVVNYVQNENVHMFKEDECAGYKAKETDDEDLDEENDDDDEEYVDEHQDDEENDNEEDDGAEDDDEEDDDCDDEDKGDDNKEDEEETDDEITNSKPDEPRKSLVENIDEEDDEEELFVVEIEGKEYYTNDEKNGEIYIIEDNEDIGDVIGKFEDGEYKFSVKEIQSLI